MSRLHQLKELCRKTRVVSVESRILLDLLEELEAYRDREIHNTEQTD